MRQASQTKRIETNEAEKISKAFGNSFYWIDVMVKQEMISASQAGYIITRKAGR